MTLARQAKWDEALDCYDQAVSLRPDFAEARRNRAQIWLARGDFERGWPEYEWRLNCPKCRFPAVNCPRWTGDDLDGRSILLVAEQGLGDTLQFIRYASLVEQRGGRVVVACPEPLIRLLTSLPRRRPCGGLEFAAARLRRSCSALEPAGNSEDDLGNHPRPRYRIFRRMPARSKTGGRLSHKRSKPPRQRRKSGTSESSRTLKIGIAWQGNRDNKVDRWRSFPLTHFAHLARLPGVRLISLQKGDGREQIAALEGQFPVAELTHPDHGDEDRRDFLDTAAVINELDLVVTPDTSLAHLAGALGAQRLRRLARGR